MPRSVLVVVEVAFEDLAVGRLAAEIFLFMVIFAGAIRKIAALDRGLFRLHRARLVVDRFPSAAGDWTLGNGGGNGG